MMHENQSYVIFYVELRVGVSQKCTSEKLLLLALRRKSCTIDKIMN